MSVLFLFNRLCVKVLFFFSAAQGKESIRFLSLDEYFFTDVLKNYYSSWLIVPFNQK